MVEAIIAFFADYSAALGGGAAALAIVEVLFSPFRSFARRWRKPEQVTLANPELLRPISPPTPPTGTMHMDLATFEAMQERALGAARKQLVAAHGEERQRLEEKIEALNARLRDPEEALAQQQAIITSLEDQLTRRSNDIGGDALAAARTALETGDFTKARILFESLAARTAPEVTANADAEFALGQIAEAEIRWHDAYRHYATAARLTPDFKTLHKARAFAWRAGDYPAALRFGDDLLKTARATGSQENLATALNEHALTLKDQGQHARAEGLLHQALEIGRATIGEAHPNFASGLNNLASVVQVQGRYDEAERLYRRALDIGRSTIGEAHPDFAIRLNNLAGVMQAQGRYDEAEELCYQALEIGRATIGEAHPTFSAHLNNLAGVISEQGRYAEAEGLFRQALEIDRATFGEAHPIIGNRLNNLASVMQAQGRYAEAEGLFAPALSICRKTLGDSHPNTQLCAANFLDFLTTHLPNSPHLSEVQAVLAAGPPIPNP